MKKNKILLKEDVVKYIFHRAEPEIAMGEDGYIAYDFKKIYPRDLAIFLPIEIEKSNYSNVFPKSLENYFSDIHDDIDYLSRLIEVEINHKIPRRIKVASVLGKVLTNHDSTRIIFRFDELIPPTEKTDLLCRVEDPYKSIDINDKMAILKMEPELIDIVNDDYGVSYLYFIVSLGQILDFGDNALAGLFAYAKALRNG